MDDDERLVLKFLAPTLAGERSASAEKYEAAKAKSSRTVFRSGKYEGWELYNEHDELVWSSRLEEGLPWKPLRE